MPREQEIVLSDAELEAIRKAAEVRGVSLEEAANDFIREAIEKRFRARARMAPSRANVVDIGARRKRD